MVEFSGPYYATKEGYPGAKRMPSGRWGIMARDVAKVYGPGAGAFRAGAAMPEYLKAQDLRAKATTRAEQLYKHSISQGYSKDAAGKIAAAAYTEIHGTSVGSPYGAPQVGGLGGPDVPILPKREELELRQNVREIMARKMPSEIGKGLSGEISKWDQQASTYNRAIESFNERYGGRELSPREMNKALAEMKRLETSRVRLEEKGTFLEGQTTAAQKVEEHRFELQRHLETGSTYEKIKKGTYDPEIFAADPLKRTEARLGLGLMAASEVSAEAGEELAVKAITATGWKPETRLQRQIARGFVSGTGTLAEYAPGIAASAVFGPGGLVLSPGAGKMMFGFGQAVKMGAETGLRMINKPPTAPQFEKLAAPAFGAAAMVGKSIVEEAVYQPGRFAGKLVATSVAFKAADWLPGKGMVAARAIAKVPVKVKAAQPFQIQYKYGVKQMMAAQEVPIYKYRVGESGTMYPYKVGAKIKLTPYQTFPRTGIKGISLKPSVKAKIAGFKQLFVGKPKLKTKPYAWDMKPPSKEMQMAEQMWGDGVVSFKTMKIKHPFFEQSIRYSKMIKDTGGAEKVVATRLKFDSGKGWAEFMKATKGETTWRYLKGGFYPKTTKPFKLDPKVIRFYKGIKPKPRPPSKGTPEVQITGEGTATIALTRTKTVSPTKATALKSELLTYPKTETTTVFESIAATKQRYDFIVPIQTQFAEMAAQMQMVGRMRERKLKQMVRPIQIPYAETVPISATAQMPAQMQVSFRARVQAVGQMVAPVQVRAVAQLRMPIMMMRTRARQLMPEIQIPKVAFAWPELRGKPEMVKGFIPMARITGEWKALGGAVPRAIAIRRGAKFVGATPARSFTIKETGGVVPKIEIQPISLRKFRAPKGKTKIFKQPVWIEKAEFAIDEPGEFVGITEKGRKAKRKKKGMRLR